MRTRGCSSLSTCGLSTRVPKFPQILSWSRSIPVGEKRVNPLYNERNLQQVSAEPALLAEVTGNLGKTGVPVLDTLSTAVQSKESLVSVASKASLDSTILIAIPLVMSYFVTMLLQRSTDDDSVGIVSTILNSIVKPISQWVPALLLVKYGTIWLSVLHLVLKKASPVIFGYTELANNAKTLAQIFQDTGECIVIVLAFRIILNVKDTFLSEMQRVSQQKSKKSGGEVLGLSRFIESIKSITSVIGWIFCGYQSLLAFGFNPIPIWTSLGASSIIIGLAAQPLLSNIVSGIAIYSSRVLVVGDHVQLLTSSGSVAIDGYVEVVSPTTCVIRDEDDCLIYINNKQMSSMILRNKSQTVVAR